MQIFVVTKNLDFVQSGELIDALRMHLEADEITLVVPSELVQIAKRTASSDNLIRVVNEVEIAGFPLSDIAKWNVDYFPRRAGWYYQQILKLAICESNLAREKYVIWDADTIPYHRIPTFDGEKLIFTRGYEFHLPYFEANEQLIGINRTSGPRFSAVSQHMPVDRAIMREMLQFMGQRSKDGSWVSAIRTALLGRKGGSLFSEYEIFADWMRVKYPARFILRSVPWLREGGLLYKPELAMAKKLAWFIAFEDWHRRYRPWPHLKSRSLLIYRALAYQRGLRKLKKAS
jgi:hypothetical protein